MTTKNDEIDVSFQRGITVVIPTIPPRRTLLHRAIDSVLDQTLPATTISVPIDNRKQGAAVNRDRGLRTVTTEYVAFLDDDDFFKPNHLEALMDTMVSEDADYVFSWYEMNGGMDPRPNDFGMPWDNDNPRQTTITTLIKTELAQNVGFIDPNDGPLDSPDRLYAGEDWFMTKGCWEAGAKVVHRPEKTWYWSHWGGNTSGLGKNWS